MWRWQKNNKENLSYDAPTDLLKGAVISSMESPEQRRLALLKLTFAQMRRALSGPKLGVSVTVVALALVAGGSYAAVNLSKHKAQSTTARTSSENQPVSSANGVSKPSAGEPKPGTTSTPSSKTSATTSSVATPSTTPSNSGSSTTATISNGGTASGGGSSGGSTSSGGGTTTDGCAYNGVMAPCVGSTTTGQNGWGSPSFDDEFSGSSLNTTVWNTHNGWTNQNGVTSYASNVSLAGGDAILTLASSTSGAEIGTNTYTLPVGGFAEARIEFPGSGTTVYNWPAWWTSGPNWPQAGEADIFEGLGSATTNYHYYSGGDQQAGPFYISGIWTGDFHIYGLYRGNGYNNVYWDGNLVKHYTTSDNGQGETLLLTVGSKNTPAYGTASQVKVDYVRAWN